MCFWLKIDSGVAHQVSLTVNKVDTPVQLNKTYTMDKLTFVLDKLSVKLTCTSTSDAVTTRTTTSGSTTTGAFSSRFHVWARRHGQAREPRMFERRKLRSKLQCKLLRGATRELCDSGVLLKNVSCLSSSHGDDRYMFEA